MLKNRNLIRFGIIVAVVAIIGLVGVVVAQSVKHEEEIAGTATVTVNTGGGGGGGGGGCTAVDPVYDFEPSMTTVDFSGEVTQGDQYTATRTLGIENTGTAGTSADCSAIPATIDSMSTSASGVADGWALTSGSPVGFPLEIGESGSIDLTLTGPAGQQDSVDLEFAITLSAN